MERQLSILLHLFILLALSACGAAPAPKPVEVNAETWARFEAKLERSPLLAKGYDNGEPDQQTTSG